MKKLTILDGHAVNPGDLPWTFLDGLVDYKVYENMLENMDNILVKEMLTIGNQVLKQATIQIINPRG